MRQAVAPEVKHVPTKDMTDDNGVSNLMLKLVVKSPRAAFGFFIVL